MAEQHVLEVRNLKKYFPITGGILSKTVGNVFAVDGVSFFLDKEETLGLVGESGCGKTTAGRVILRLIELTDGEIYFEGQDITRLPKAEMRDLRRHMQIIFQDPYASLNPRMTVGNILGEPLRIHKVAKGQALEDRVAELLEKVGLHPDHRRRYPHEFSGGQRQRIGIARALYKNASVLLFDEATSSLDSRTEREIVEAVERLSERHSELTILIISHREQTLGFCDRIIDIG